MVMLFKYINHAAWRLGNPLTAFIIKDFRHPPEAKQLP
jgi:hypothetical protein